ncbi:hypothetical protein ACHAWF_015179 [Thalassiosira exigua]
MLRPSPQRRPRTDAILLRAASAVASIVGVGGEEEPCPSARRPRSHPRRARRWAHRPLVAVGPRTFSSAAASPRPRLSAAIVGAGPSGFYAAKYLAASAIERIREEVEDDGEDGAEAGGGGPRFEWSGIDVDLLERLPAPYGLVRYGVAPDHPEVKNVERDFAALFDRYGAKSDDDGDDDGDCDPPPPPVVTLSYFGNVDVGSSSVSLSELRSLYDVVILAYGCQTSDRRLNIPGEDDLEGVLSAREFVAWYNGHPEFGHVGDVVTRCLWPEGGPEEGEGAAGDGGSDEASPANVVVVGHGNVALDCARILAKGKPGLFDTDAPSSVLGVLKGGASRVSVVGRRGHVQGAFTIKELRELTKLRKEGHDAAFLVRQEELDSGATEASAAELKGLTGRPKARIDKLLRDAASIERNDQGELLRRAAALLELGPRSYLLSATSDASKVVELRFLLNPVRFEPSDADSERVGRVVCERTRLEGEPFRQRAAGTGSTESFPADLVLVSVGYKGAPLAGSADGLCDWFDDDRGVAIHDRGTVTGEDGLFVAGWIKRGPRGIVGTNIADAKETVSSVMEYLDERERGRSSSEGTGGTVQVKAGRAGLGEILQRRGAEGASEAAAVVEWSQFEKIEAAERERGRRRSDAQPREKILSREEMLEVAGAMRTS